MRVLLLSAYAAQSHVYWRRGLQEMLPDWHWQVLELPPRYFSWRVRGNPLSWALEQREMLAGDHDLLLATSMVDLATLRGLVPELARLPSVLYFHENQFDYPQDRQQHSLLEAQMVSLYGALAADRVLFNSAWNRDSFLGGCDGLLQRLPDHVPGGITELLRARCQVLPVPLLAADTEAVSPHWPGGGRQGTTRLLWSARFEHDKGGEGLLRLLQQLEREALDYELALTGQQFRNSPAVFADVERQFGHRLVQFGYVEDARQYRALQSAADVILSTAEHEFQGLAVMQAVAAGCHPVVPDRLAYRELYPAHCRYDSSPADPEAEAHAAANCVLATVRGQVDVPSVAAYHAAALAGEYRQLLEAVAATG